MGKSKLLIILMIFNLTNFYSYNALPNGWYSIPSGSNSTLRSVHFTSENTGIIVGYGPSIIMRTTNAGENWTVTNFTLNGINLYMLYFVNDQTGWITGDNNTSPFVNVILKTTNAGITWTEQRQGNGYIRNMHFLNAQTGWISGSYFLKTTNGGTNWVSTLPMGYVNSSCVFFVNEQTGWAGGMPSGPVSVIKTTDGGQTWSTQVTGSECYELYFANAQTGYAVLQDGVKKTTNSGANWFISFNAGWGISLSFLNAETGWVIPQYSGTARDIIKTYNGGINWINDGYSGTEILNDIFMFSNTHGWAVCDNGIIYRTTTGGSTVGIEPISGSMPGNFDLQQNYPNPFNPVTKIKFQIPLSRGVDAEGGRGVLTKLSVYDLLGREVASLVNEQLAPGTYEYQWDASIYPSGIYCYRLIAGDFSEVNKMVLIK